MKKCKFCNKDIQEDSKKCQFCEKSLEKNKLENNEIDDKNSEEDLYDFILNIKYVEYIKYKKGFFNFLFNPKGRINRLEYIYGFLLTIFIYFAIYILWIFVFAFMLDSLRNNFFLDNEKSLLIISSSLISFLVCYNIITLTIKRFHDIGKSGWFSLIPIYNIIVPSFFKGIEKENSFGNNLGNKQKLINSEIVLNAMISFFVIDILLFIIFIIVAVNSIPII